MPDIVAAKLKKSDGPAGLSPTRPSNSGTPSSRLLLTRPSRKYATHSTFPKIRYSLDVPENTLLTRRSRKYATHSSAPTTRDLVNGSRTSFLASRRRSARPRRHAGGRRPASAARRACWRLVILEVR